MWGNTERGEANWIIGEAVTMLSITKYGARYALSRAVENVDQRLEEAPEAMSLPSRAVMHRPRSSAHAHLERRAYETVLDDLLRDEPKLRQRTT